MRFHRLRLSFIRNRILIVWGGVLALWTFSFLLLFILLSDLRQLAQNIESLQKGTTCILLIQPADRTKDNILDCVNKNNPEDRSFDFKESTQKTKSITFKPDNTPSNMHTPEIKVEETSSKEMPRSITIRFETRINAMTGRIECRLPGETWWIQEICP